jgi:hypothetical protein
MRMMFLEMDGLALHTRDSRNGNERRGIYTIRGIIHD